MTQDPKKPSQDDIAQALNLSTRRVRQLIGDGMPSNSIENALAWRKAETQGDSAEQLRKARILLVESQTARVELENARIAGQFLPIGELRTAQQRIGNMLRSRMLRLIHELPPIVEGLPAAKVAEILKTEVYRALNEFCDSLDELAAGKPID